MRCKMYVKEKSRETVSVPNRCYRKQSAGPHNCFVFDKLRHLIRNTMGLEAHLKKLLQNYIRKIAEKPVFRIS